VTRLPDLRLGRASASSLGMERLVWLILCSTCASASEPQAPQARPARSVLLLQRSAERAAAATLSSVLADVTSNTSSKRQSVVVSDQSRHVTRANCSGMPPCFPYDLTEPMKRHGPATSSQGIGLTASTKMTSNASQKVSQPVGDPLSGEDDDGQPSYSDEDAREWSKMLPCELHLAGTTIQALLDHYAEESADLLENPISGRPVAFHSLATLLMRFREELAKACKVTEEHILMNSVYGRFLRPASSGSSVLKARSSIGTLDTSGASLLNSGGPFGERLGEEVVVRFFVLPKQDGDDFSSVIAALRESLANNSSSLMNGKLSDVMKHASLTIGYQDVAGFTAIPADKLSNLALPFAISAIFTGILIWLAG